MQEKMKNRKKVGRMNDDIQTKERKFTFKGREMKGKKKRGRI